MRNYLVDVEDSDGFDSTQDVYARDPKEARRKAINAHFCASGYADWQDEDSACPAIINVRVY
jgi:hypothetical protein